MLVSVPPLCWDKQNRVSGFTVTHWLPDVHQAKELPTFKDNDFINDGQKIYISEENKKMFLEKLRKDVEVCVRQRCSDPLFLLPKLILIPGN